jgi:hypothetical protein
VRFLTGIDHLLPFLVVLTEGRDALVITSLRQLLVHEGGKLIIIVDTGPGRRLILLIGFGHMPLPIADRNLPVWVHLAQYLLLVAGRQRLDLSDLCLLIEAVTLALRELNVLESDAVRGLRWVVDGTWRVSGLEMPREGCEIRDRRLLGDRILGDTPLATHDILLGKGRRHVILSWAHRVQERRECSI